MVWSVTFLLSPSFSLSLIGVGVSCCSFLPLIASFAAKQTPGSLVIVLPWRAFLNLDFSALSYALSLSHPHIYPYPLTRSLALCATSTCCAWITSISLTCRLSLPAFAAGLNHWLTLFLGLLFFFFFPSPSPRRVLMKDKYNLTRTIISDSYREAPASFTFLFYPPS